MLATIILPIVMLGAHDRLDLKGAVVDSHGASLSGATVFISSAAVRSGTSTICPSCYADCAKHARSDASGNFLIPSVSPDLLFRILVVADGYAATFVDRIDPALAAVKVSLEPVRAYRTKHNYCLRGRIIDERGRPVVGATLVPLMVKTSQYFGQSSKAFDPVAVTNGKGEFMMTSGERIIYAILRVDARGFASMATAELGPNEAGHTLTVRRGAIVRGRIRQNGKSLVGISMGLVQVDKGYFLHEMEIGTDDKGQFLFSNVPPEQDYYLYGKMASLGYLGAVATKRVSAGKNEKITDVGDINTKPGHRLSGQIVLSDGSPLPRGVRIGVGRDGTWDTQDQQLDESGCFSFDGIPDELIVLQVNIPGYRLSARNKSLEQTTRREMKGMVDRDIDLRILLDPGKYKYFAVTRAMVELQETQNASLLEGVPKEN